MLKSLNILELLKKYHSVTGYGFRILCNYSDFENEVNIYLTDNNELHVFCKVNIFLNGFVTINNFLFLGYCKLCKN